MSADEKWRVISDAPDYAVSTLGRVKRVVPDQFGRGEGSLCRPQTSRVGYHRFCLYVDGRKTYRSGHSLVCAAFNGPRPSEHMQCAHKDGSKTNNVPENLYWATAKENAADRKRHGTESAGDHHWTRLYPERVLRGERRPGDWAKGERMPAAKLTETQVLEIYATPKKHGSGRMLAERFGVSMGLIGHIRNGRAWAYLTRHEGKSAAQQHDGAQARE